MKITAMILSHMNSARFYGKCGAILFGKPILVWIIERLLENVDVDEVVAAISIEKCDDPLEEMALAAGGRVFRGDAKDLMKRQRGVIEVFKPDYILPVSGDSPFFDFRIPNRLIAACRKDDDPSQVSYRKAPGDNASFDSAILTLNHISYYYWLFSHFMSAPRDLYEKHKEAYWTYVGTYVGTHPCELHSHVDPVNCRKVGMNYIDCDDIWPKEKTTVKLSIDWALELALWDAVLTWLGYFPNDYNELLSAYRSITHLEVVE